MLSYVVTVFVVGVPWGDVFRAIVLPPFSFDKNYVLIVVGALGTPMSPYLFFWQAEEEVEEEQENSKKAPFVEQPNQAPNEFYRIRLDTYVGAALSQSRRPLHHADHCGDPLTVSLTSSRHRRRPRRTADRRALRLRVVCLWHHRAGLLALPVLAGSAAYALGEARRWPVKSRAWIVAFGRTNSSLPRPILPAL